MLAISSASHTPITAELRQPSKAMIAIWTGAERFITTGCTSRGPSREQGSSDVADRRSKKIFDRARHRRGVLDLEVMSGVGDLLPLRVRHMAQKPPFIG